MIGLHLGTLVCIKPGNGIVYTATDQPAHLANPGKKHPFNLLAKEGKPSHPDPRDPLFPVMR